MIDKNLEAF